MASRAALIDRIQEMLTTMSTTRAAGEPDPWLHIDLSMAQLRALLVLHHLGTLRVGPLSHELGLSPNAMTSVLDRLEDAGMVERHPDRSDRRAVLVGLTSSGDRLISDLLSASAQHLGTRLARLATEELEALHLGIAALFRTVQEDAPEPVTAPER